MQGKQNASQSLKNSKPDKNQAKIDSLNKAHGSNFGKFIKDGLFHLLTSIRSIGINYTQGVGTVIPGFTPVPSALGNNWSLNAPGLGLYLAARRIFAPLGRPG